MKFIDGCDLKVGDTIAVWWKPGRDTITAIRQYNGPLSHLWNGKARLASFATNTTGMTIEPQATFELLFRSGESQAA